MRSCSGVSAPDPTDSALVLRVLDGDGDAFGVLVARHHARCLRLAIHVLGSREDAEDAVQETFLRAYRSLGTYEDRDRFGGWLARILVNQCRTALTRRTRSAETVADWEWAAAPDGVTEHPADRAALREELQRALAALDPAQREAVVLKFADDMTYDEISAVTGASVSALKMRVQRACRRLRALLGESAHA
jgi:RNA polymerase sigma-70 factor (ECF subfamily)